MSHKTTRVLRTYPLCMFDFHEFRYRIISMSLVPGAKSFLKETRLYDVTGESSWNYYSENITTIDYDFTFIAKNAALKIHNFEDNPVRKSENISL